VRPMIALASACVYFGGIVELTVFRTGARLLGNCGSGNF